MFSLSENKKKLPKREQNRGTKMANDYVDKIDLEGEQWDLKDSPLTEVVSKKFGFPLGNTVLDTTVTATIDGYLSAGALSIEFVIPIFHLPNQVVQINYLGFRCRYPLGGYFLQSGSNGINTQNSNLQFTFEDKGYFGILCRCRNPSGWSLTSGATPTNNTAVSVAIDKIDFTITE